MVKIKKQSKFTKKTLLIGLILLFIIVGSTLFALNKSTPHSTPQGTKATGKVNLDPPTDEDKNSVDENKERIVEQGNQPTTNGKKTVVPVITYASQYSDSVEVGGYISGIFENGGVCTSTFSKDGVTITKTTSGVENVSSVNCPVLIAQSSEFVSKGQWNVVLSYSSSSAAGQSSAKVFEVR